MRHTWNKRHPDKKIHSKHIKTIETKLKHYLSICKDQKMFIESYFEKENEFICSL